MNSHTTDPARSAAIRSAVELSRIEYLLVQSPVGIVISPLACLFVSLALVGEVQAFKLFVWNAGMSILALFRFWIWTRAPRSLGVDTQPQFWQRWLGGSMTAVALWWGVGGFFILPGTPLGDLIVLTAVVMMAGGTGSLYSIHPFLSTICVICLATPVPTYLALTSEHTFLRVMGFGTPLFTLGILRGVQTLNHYLVRAHELTYDLSENIKLLERSEQMRNDLTLMLVHDLRTPLMALMTHTQLAREYTQESNVEQSLEELQRTAELSYSLTSMVGSILDVNRMESDEFPLSWRKVPLAKVVELSLESLGSMGLGVKIQAPEELVVCCDVDLISRVLTNLIGNALRYQPPNTPVRIAVTNSLEEVEIRVIDEGPGVSALDQVRIFDKYAQVSQGSRAYTSGLGLTFCKMAVERHGGTIGVRSQEGKGSEFWIRLPHGSQHLR